MEKSIKYEIAMAETLHYLKGIKKEDVDKIPNKLIKFLQENALKDYECKFDYRKPLNELELKEETKGLIAMICLNYWCQTKEQKNALVNKLNENEKRYQEELREKYNPDNIFKKEQKINKEETYALVECKEKNIIEKLLDRIKSFLRKNKR